MEDLIKALQIMLKYGNPEYPTWCEHDVLHVCDIDPSKVSDADLTELDELGFIEDEDGFVSFKFGSA